MRTLTRGPGISLSHLSVSLLQAHYLKTHAHKLQILTAQLPYWFTLSIKTSEENAHLLPQLVCAKEIFPQVTGKVALISGVKGTVLEDLIHGQCSRMTDNKGRRSDAVNDAQRVRAKFERRDLCHLWSGTCQYLNE